MVGGGVTSHSDSRRFFRGKGREGRGGRVAKASQPNLETSGKVIGLDKKRTNKKKTEEVKRKKNQATNKSRLCD